MRDQRRKIWRLSAGGGTRALGADGTTVRDELIEDLDLLGIKSGSYMGLAILSDQRLVAIERLLDLNWVIGHDLGSGIDSGQATADDAGREPHLQVGKRRALCGSAQLQTHQKVRGLADATAQVVFDIDNGRLTCACRDRNMMETKSPCVIQGQRAAKTYTAVDTEGLQPARQREIDDFEKIFVPAHCDSVLGNATKAEHHALVEFFSDLAVVADRARWFSGGADEFFGQRLYLEGIDPDHPEAFIHQVMREGVARRSETNHQRVLAVVRQHMRPLDVERIEAGQETVDLKAPRHVEHVGQHVGLDLRDVDGFGFLVNATFHAVVADTVPGARAHGVVDHDQGQRADVVAAAFDQVHLGDLLAQRTAGDGDAERVVFKAFAALVAHALGAGVGIALVAVNTVIHFVEHATFGEARVGEFEAIPTSTMVARAFPSLVALAGGGLVRHQIVEIRARRLFEQHPVPGERMCRRIGDGVDGPTAQQVQRLLDDRSDPLSCNFCKTLGKQR